MAGKTDDYENDLLKLIFQGTAIAAVSKNSNAAAGSFTLTGQTATALRAYKSSADAANYALTGQDATGATSGPQASIAEAGSWVIAGQDAFA